MLFYFKPIFSPGATRQKTKFIVIITSILIALITVGSSIFIYRSNHSGEKSNGSTGKSPSAKQADQYRSSNVTVTTAIHTENIRRQVIADFLNGYLINKNGGKNQDATLAKYGTANLINQYHSSTDNKFIFCGVPGTFSGVSIADRLRSEGNMSTYPVTIFNNKSEAIQVQLRVVGQGSSSLIDASLCPDPI